MLASSGAGCCSDWSRPRPQRGDIVGEEEKTPSPGPGVWNSVSMLRGGGLNPYREMPDTN